MVEVRSDKVDIINFLHKILFTIFAISITYKYYVYYNNLTLVKYRIANPAFKLLGPYDTMKIKLKDKYNQLIDLNDFEFIVNPDPCKDYPAGLLLLIIVSSSPSHTRSRMVIRETWGENTDSTKVVFLIGDPVNFNLTHEIAEESATYGDIVQGNFVDSYRNMTYKHVMGLKWVAHHCPTAKYILKTDDDVVVNIRGMRHFLSRDMSPWGATRLIACTLKFNAIPERIPAKWKATFNEYPYKTYPTYCRGFSILYSQDVITRLLNKVKMTPFLWIDDIYVTGLLAENARIPRTSLSNVQLDIHPYIYSRPELSSMEMKKYWNGVPNKDEISNRV